MSIFRLAFSAFAIVFVSNGLQASFIFKGMGDKQVGKAMDLQPERISTMMFVSNQVTDEQGKPKINPETTEPEDEKDDCD